MTITYAPQGTCSRKFTIEAEDGVIKSVTADGGCQGNFKGIAALLRGMDIRTAVSRLKGIKCGTRGTSCPDQLAKALESML